MATYFANDVFSYCTKRGSPVYTCSLDAEGAFDVHSHSVLEKTALNVVPDHCWRVMVHWYSSITVRIKWNGKPSDSIKVCKGTRQGGLSPLSFLMYSIKTW